MTTEEQRPQDAQQTSASTAEDSNTSQAAPEQTFVLSTTEAGMSDPPMPLADAVSRPAAADAAPTSTSEDSNTPSPAAAVEDLNPAPAAQAEQRDTATVQHAAAATQASEALPQSTQPTAVSHTSATPPSPPAAAETAITGAPQAVEALSADPAATDSAAAALETSIDAAMQHAVQRPSERLRDKVGVRSEERAHGSEDVKSQRPDTPTFSGPIDIPTVDDLDASLEEQINAAMTGGPTKAVLTPDSQDSGEQQVVSPSASESELELGSKIKGVVQQIHNDDVFLEAGLRSSLVVSLKQFPNDKHPVVGDQLDVIVDSADEDGLLRARLPRARHKAGGDWSSLVAGQVVDCIVTGTNKGGLQITVSNLKGFLPASQVDVGYVSDLSTFVGQKLTVQVTEVNPKKRNLVVSRRVLLQAERAEAEGEFWKGLQVGQEMDGTVKTIKNYGAFINLGPVDGFLHIGEMSWSRINHPNDVLKEGQEVQVKVLKLDEEKKRISLGMKQMVQNPWLSASEKYASERIVSGRVSRVTDFGAFIELEPGVEGMVHISELAWRRVGSVKEVLTEGETREFKIIEVDPKRKRVSLSLKALEQRPEAEKPEADIPAEEAVQRRRANQDLRGGMGQSGSSGLFGNPSDFS